MLGRDGEKKTVILRIIGLFPRRIARTLLTFFNSSGSLGN